MVYFMENPIKMDDLGGFPIIFGNTHKDPYQPTSIQWKVRPFFLRGSHEYVRFDWEILLMVQKSQGQPPVGLKKKNW